MFKGCAIALLSAGVVCLSSGAAEIPLKNADMDLRISAESGQVLTLADASDGTRYIAATADLYFWGREVAGGKTSDETRDVVTQSRLQPRGVTFSCTNRDFPWLSLTKEYTLEGNILSKKVTYQSDVDTDNLFSIRSSVKIAPDLWKEGAFFLPIDDGYKVGGNAVVENRLVKGDAPVGTTNNAIIINSFPARNRVLAHYLYHINDRMAHPGMSPVPGFLSPGGWQAGMGCEFVRKEHPYSITTHFTLVKGDPRNFHQQYYSLPEFLEFRKHPAAADWVKDIVQWQSEDYQFYQLLDPSWDLYTFGQMQRDMRSIYPDELAYTLIGGEWAPRGDYELRDPMRYRGPDMSFNHTVPLTKMHEAFQRVQEYSKRQKVAWYTIVSSVTDTPESWYQTHKDWLVYNKDGSVKPGFGGYATPDYGVDFAAPGWADNYLRQVEENIKHFGVDYWYIDSSPWWEINWKARRVASTADAIAFYNRLRNEVLDRYHVPLMLNCGWGSALFCDFGLFENYNFPAMEKQDWRVEAYMSFMCKLARLRPYGFPCGMVQAFPVWNFHISGYGLNGLMGAGTSNGPAIFPYSVLFQRMSTELFDAVSVPLAVHPSWWRGETNDLEIGTLRKRDAYVLPVIWHGEQPVEQLITLDAADLGLDGKASLFLIESEVTCPPRRDLSVVQPYTEEAVAIRACRELPPSGRIEHRMALPNQVLHYLFLSQVPGIVYSFQGRLCYTMLPENRGVRITGKAPIGADAYSVEVACSAPSAEVLLWAPAAWPGVSAETAGKPIAAELVEAGGAKFLKVAVAEGNTAITVRRQDAAAKPAALANPRVESWEKICSSFKYSNMSYRTMLDDGEPCLEVTLDDKNRPGRFVIDLFPDVINSGLDFIAKADKPSARIQLQILSAAWNNFSVFSTEAAPDWSTTLATTDWQKFSLRQADFGKASLLSTRMLKLTLLPANGASSLKIKGLRLLIAHEQAAQKIQECYAVVPKVMTPPNVTENSIETLWSGIAPQDDFVDIDGITPAKNSAVVRMCYDDEALYFLIRNPQPIATGEPEKAHNAPTIWNSNCNEILISPVPNGSEYFHFMVDSGGNRYDSVNTALGENKEWNGQWQSGVAINYQVSWDAKVRIPFATLGARPKVGDLWRLNVTRAERATGLTLSSWSPSPGDWGQPNCFGSIVFGGPVGEKFDLGSLTVLHARLDGSLNAIPLAGALHGICVGAASFVEGLDKGRALVVSNTMGCHFPSAVDLAGGQGSVEFYLQPLDWHRSDGLQHQLFSAGGAAGGVSLYAGSSNLICVLASSANPNQRFEQTVSAPLPNDWVPGRWHHVLFTWDTRQMTCYVDSGVGATAPTGKDAPRKIQGDAQLGAHPWLKDEGRTAIEELRIYPRMLTPHEVRQRYGEFNRLAGAAR